MDSQSVTPAIGVSQSTIRNLEAHAKTIRTSINLKDINKMVDLISTRLKKNLKGDIYNIRGKESHTYLMIETNIDS